MTALIDKLDKMLRVKNLLSLLLAVLMLFSLTNITIPASAAEVTDDEAPIIVSMGDSYSAGEGIEKFYDQDLDNKDKVKSPDWLAHRSERSWPGMLKFPGLSGTAKDHKDKNWFFVAASGAETKHLQYEQDKEYSRGVVGQYSGTAYLRPQLEIFEKLPANSVDYVTLTLGGNDAGFSTIIKEAVIGSTYLNTSKLSDMIADVWEDFYKKDGIRDSLYKSYKDIEKAAGTQAQIIVAGYPQLLDPNGGGWPFSKEEATEINRAVSNFNIEIERLVEQCANEGMKICFVSVESAFDGHEVWSSRPYINEVYIGTKDEDLKNIDVASSYSVHPNYNGAIEYAKCVNAKIEELAKLEEERAEQEAMNPTPKDREIVMVLDRSGSMSGKPLQETKAAAKKFVTTALKAEANVGIVTYETSATVCSALTGSEKYLHKKIDEIGVGGGTNIEAGLKLADDMLEVSEAKKKIIVLMSDGEPNDGKVGQELIDYAAELKEKGYYIYTLGFFSNLGNAATAHALMESIASEGCHFPIESAESLQFFFGDIADQISGTRYYYIRIACPVDVTVKYNGEKMTSKGNDSSVRTSFGTMSFEENVEEDEEKANGKATASDTSSKNDNRIKILRLKEGVEYDIQIEGNGKGTMNYTIGFMDEDGEYTDMRRFTKVNITKKTKIDTVASVSDKTYMYVDEDGDGEYDITYVAEENSKAKIVDYSIYIYIGLAVVAAAVLAVCVLLLIRHIKIKRYL